MQGAEGQRRRLLIFGTTAMSERMHFYLDRYAHFDCVGFVVDRQHRACDTHLGLPVHDYEDLVDTCPPMDHDVFVAVGYSQGNRGREAIYGRLEAGGYQVASFFAPSAAINVDELGTGTVVLDNATVGGCCSIGKRVFLGGGVIVKDGLSIADDTFIGMGAVVTRSIEVPGVYVGHPARLVRKF